MNSKTNDGKNIKLLVAPVSYNVSNDVDVIEVDTSSGGLTDIYLQTIAISDPRKPLYINDYSGNASVGNIRVFGSGGNLVNNVAMLVLADDGISAQVQVADRKRWIANLSTDDSTPPVPPVPDKNFVYTQVVPALVWVVNHNLNKFVSVSIVNAALEEVSAQIDYVDVNTVIITFNQAMSGFAYCN